MERVSFYKADIEELEKSLLENVIESKLLTVGPFIWRFEEEVKKFLKVPYFLATSSGTAAFHIALKVLGIGPGDEVILSPLIHIGVVNTLLEENIGICLVDIDEERFTLNPRKVRNFILENYAPSERELRNKKTGKILKGIVLYHIYGIPPAVEEFSELRKEFGLKIIDVCWESFGSKVMLNEEMVYTGSIFDVGVFSFTRYGPLNVGEGGGVAFRREEDYKKAEMLRYHGVAAEYVEYKAIMGGFNYNLDELSSAVGVGQMIRINQILAKRRMVYEHYKQGLLKLEKVRVLNEPKDAHVSWYSFTILLPEDAERDFVIREMLIRGVPTKVFYPLVNKLEFFDSILAKELISCDLDVAVNISPRLLSLPFYGDLERKEIEHVVNALREVLNL